MKKSKQQLEEEILNLWKQFLEYDNQVQEAQAHLAVTDLLMRNGIPFECEIEQVWHNESVVLFNAEFDVHESIYDLVIDGLNSLGVKWVYNISDKTITIEVKLIKE